MNKKNKRKKEEGKREKKRRTGTGEKKRVQGRYNVRMSVVVYTFVKYKKNSIAPQYGNSHQQCSPTEYRW